MWGASQPGAERAPAGAPVGSRRKAPVGGEQGAVALAAPRLVQRGVQVAHAQRGHAQTVAVPVLGAGGEGGRGRTVKG